MMADFNQSAAARGAMQDAGLNALYNTIMDGPAKALANALDVTPRTVERWRAFINDARGKPSAGQKRNPANALPKVAGLGGSPRLTFRGEAHVGGSPKYARHLNVTVGDGPFDLSPDILMLAVYYPDAAWEAFFDAYGFPPATIEEVERLEFDMS